MLIEIEKKVFKDGSSETTCNINPWFIIAIIAIIVIAAKLIFF